MRLIGKLGKKLLSCESAAAEMDKDATKCRNGRENGFRKAFQKRGCGADVELLVEQTSDAVDDLVTRLRPGDATGRCVAEKLAVVGRYWRERIVAGRECVEDGIDCTAKLAKVDARFVGRFEELETKRDCATTGDSGTQRERVIAGSSAISSCILGTLTCERTSEDVPPGGSATTDPEDDGASPVDPVETTVESPTGGEVTISEAASSGAELPSEFVVLGTVIKIEAPDATAADPLRIEFILDASVLPPGLPIQDVILFRDQVPVADCADASGQANPDPCIASRTVRPDGDLVIVVLTSHASDWAAGVETRECTLTVSRTDTATQYSLQLSLDYSAAGAELTGAGSTVECTNLLGGALATFYDDDASRLLHAGQVVLSSAATPADIMTCAFTAPAKPDAGSFVAIAVDAANAPTAGGQSGVCGAPVTGNSPPLARDALAILQAAVGQAIPCAPCSCDVNGSGALTASDSLLALRAAVWLSGVTLTCGTPCTPSGAAVPADPEGATLVVSRVACEGDPTTTTTTTTVTTTSTTTTTLDGIACAIELSRTDTAADGALQFVVDYLGATVVPNDSDADVQCANQASGALTAFFNDEASSTLEAGFVSLDGIMSPALLARCTFRADGVPVPADFEIDVLDAAQPDATDAETGGGVCGAPSTGQSPPYARDALHILRFAVGFDAPCEPCECDSDNNGSVTASDSLRPLRAAVGQAVTLSCPGGCSGSIQRSPTPGAAVVTVSDVDCSTTTTTLEQVACDIGISRTDAATNGALQLDLDYSGVDAEPNGTGATVACTNTASGAIAAFNDDEVSRSLALGFVSIAGFSTPSQVASCNFTSAGVPSAGDFAVTVLDSALPDGADAETGGGACGAPSTGQSPPYARDALHILSFAVGNDAPCEPCECDTNGSGAVTASDSLASLRAAVGQPVTLTCPGTCSGSIQRSPNPGTAVATVSSVSCSSTSTTTTTTTTTLPGPQGCSIGISLTSPTTAEALQLSVGYSGSGASIDGTAASVDCTNEVSGTLASFFDYEPGSTLRLGFAGLNGFTGPVEVARCNVTSTSTPNASSFIVTVTDAAVGGDLVPGGNVCGAPVTGQTIPSARDALQVLRNAVGLEAPCELCECDTDSNGFLTASDSLRTLRAGVAANSETLVCPDTCGTPVPNPPSAGGATATVTSVSCTP